MNPHRLLSLLLLLISSLLGAQSKDCFVAGFKDAYAKCSYLHPYDSLTYIPSIMNLADRDFSNWDKATISQKRESFYGFFSTPIILACVYAIDLNNGSLYMDPTGNIRYGRIKKNRHYGKLRKKFIVAPVNSWASSQYWCALISYLQTHSFDYCFQIENIGDTTKTPFWIIEGDSFYVIEYNANDNRFYGYDADDYITTRAPDDCFLSFEGMQHQ